MYQIGKMPASIDIGYIGENLFRSIEIDMTAWVEKYPDGVCSIVHTRPGETDEDAYIADTTFDSETNVLTWQITEADLGTIDGEGNIQIWIEEERSLDDDIRGKSVNIKSIVNKSVGTPSSTPPAPQTAWLESMTALKTATVNAAEAADDAKDDAVAAKEAAEDAQEAAEAAAVHQPTVGQNGNWYVWNQTAGEYQDTQIPASGDPTILINDSSTANNRAWSAYKVDDELNTVKSDLTAIDDAVFTTGQEVVTAPDLFLTVTDTDLMLSIDETSFSESPNQSGFYIDVSAYRGKELMIKRTENGAVLRGVFTHDVPAVGVTFSGANKWDKGITGRCVIINVPNDNTINYVYIAYHSTNGDTITKQQALAGMTVFQPNGTNQFIKRSDDLILGFSGGAFNQSQVLYGFYVPIDEPAVPAVMIKRTNTGTRFRYAFSENVPAVGVSYLDYSSDAFDTKKEMYAAVPSGAKYLYIAYWRSTDTATKEDMLAGMGIRFCIPAEITVDTGKQNRIEMLHNEVYEKGTENLFDKRSESMLLGVGTDAFASSDQLHGFYVPIDPDKGTTVTIRRKNAGQRFRIVSCADIPAVGVTFTSGKRITPDTEKVAVYDKIVSTDKYLYIAYYNPNYDTLTEAEMLAGFTIIYGSEHDYVADESRINQLDYLKSVGFTNGNINSTGKLVESAKHIVSTNIRVNGRYGISANDDYTVTVHEFDFDGKYINSYTVTNAVKYFYHWGNIRVVISDNTDVDITPADVDFSSIKIPCNRFSAQEYANSESFVLDAENCLCDDVFAYIDSVADTHGMYATKTLLCTETSGISTYYYTLGSGTKKLCILSGQHGPGNGGDPRDSVITVAKLVHDLIDGNFAHGSFLQKLHDEYTILVIPILNAYGFNNFSRTDANDVDTNRDWVDAETIEVGAAKPIIAAFDPDIAFDVHCNGTTPVANVDIEIQLYLGTYNNAFKGEVEDYFKSYYNMNVATREANSTETFSYYIVNTLQAYGGLLELRWWLKNKKWMHDYQAESGNYAMLVNVIKYFDAVSESETYAWEKTPNQNQY